MSAAVATSGTRGRAHVSGAALLLALFVALFAGFAHAQNWPALTGRIVDGAHVLSAAARAAIEPKLADLERKSGIQLVVATVPTLGDQDIETYANGLFRAWGLGEKSKNNGVLFLVAPKEHRVRIEVGYGLEGTLTDATSKIIIANAVAPRFKTGDFDGGITRGVDDIITVLTTDASEWQKRPSLREDQSSQGQAIGNGVIAFLLFAFIVLLLFCRTCRDVFFQILFSIAISGRSGGGGSWSGGSSSGSFGGGFSGGGGSSGGGGASGSW